MTDKKHTSSDGFVILKRYNNLHEKSFAKRMIEFTVMANILTVHLGFGLLGIGLPMILLCTLLKYLNIILLLAVGYAVHAIPTEVHSYEQILIPALIGLVIMYTAHWFNDRDAENRGGHPQPWLRSLPIWKYVADYFPIQLVLSKELCAHSKADPNLSQQREVIVGSGFYGLATDKNYLVGYHPHGITGFGSFLNFITNATGFPQAFLGINSWLAIHKLHFLSVFYREIGMRIGVIPATRKAIHYLLDSNECHKTGNLVVVVLGGGTEILEAHPGRYVMCTSRRFGFFKLALETGSSLIPCISFGENNMYKQIKNDRGKWIRRIQDWVETRFEYPLAIFYARGLIPYRTPINTVVGAPIPCEQMDNPTREDVGQLKQRYLHSLQQLFEQYKMLYDPDAGDIEFI